MMNNTPKNVFFTKIKPIEPAYKYNAVNLPLLNVLLTNPEVLYTINILQLSNPKEQHIKKYEL